LHKIVSIAIANFRKVRNNLKNTEKREPYGYVAKRPHFMSIEEQTEELVAKGVHPKNILNQEDGIDRAIGWCDHETNLIVYSATVFGTVTEYDRVIKELGKVKSNLIVIRADDLSVSGSDSLPYLNGKKDLNLRNALIGRTIGRKKTITRELAAKIIDFVKVQGNSQTDAHMKYGASKTQVSKIINGKYFEANREKK
jgi:hypothetical protein